MQKLLSLLKVAAIVVQYCTPIVYLAFFTYAVASQKGRKWLWYCFIIGMTAVSTMGIMLSIMPEWCMRHNLWHPIIAYTAAAVVGWAIHAGMYGDVSEIKGRRELVSTGAITLISILAMRSAWFRQSALTDQEGSVVYFNYAIIVLGVVLVATYWITILACRARPLQRLILSVAVVVMLSVLATSVPIQIPIIPKLMVSICFGLITAWAARRFVLGAGISPGTNIFRMSGAERTDLPVVLRLIAINSMLTGVIFLTLIWNRVSSSTPFFSAYSAVQMLPLLPALLVVFYLWLMNLATLRRVAVVAMVKDWRRPPLRSPWRIAGWKLTFPVRYHLAKNESPKGHVRKVVGKYWIVFACAAGISAGYVLNWLMWRKNMDFFTRHQLWVDGVEISTLFLSILVTVTVWSILRKCSAPVVRFGRIIKAFFSLMPKNIAMVRNLDNTAQIQKVVEDLPPDAGRIWISIAAQLAPKNRELLLDYIAAWLRARESRPSVSDDEIARALLKDHVIGKGNRQWIAAALFSSQSHQILKLLQSRGQLDEALTAELVWDNPELVDQVIKYDADIAYNALFIGNRSDAEVGQLISECVSDSCLTKLLSDQVRFRRLWLLVDERVRNVIHNAIPVEVVALAHESDAACDYFWRTSAANQSALVGNLGGRAAAFFEKCEDCDMDIFSRLPEKGMVNILEHIESDGKLARLFGSIKSDPEKLSRIMESLSPKRLAQILTLAIENVTSHSLHP